MPSLSIPEAAKHLGKERSTLFKAIKSGRISATKNENGEWVIDVAELERVYPSARNVPREETEKIPCQALPQELAVLQRENTLLREMVDDLRGERDRLIKAMENRLITDQRPNWWQRFKGKG